MALEAKAARRLVQWQAELDALPTHADRVDAAAKRFKSRNTSRNATFHAVRTALGIMCPANRRCGYCEDSAADEVEHIAPKAHYPELAFVWANYLYACGPCNGPKNDKYAIRNGTGLVVELRSGTNAPPAGYPLLIDPRVEDPLSLLELDLRGTFFIVPAFGLGAHDRERANWTIDTLDLNRPYLATGRESAFGSYRARIREYVADRDAGAPTASLDSLRKGLLGMHHPTVFKEMQRQSGYDPAMRSLFAPAPEALTW